MEPPAAAASVDSHNDHRIAMMLAVAATCADGAVDQSRGAESVAKSYPNFWEDYEQLGGTSCAENGVSDHEI